MPDERPQPREHLTGEPPSKSEHIRLTGPDLRPHMFCEHTDQHVVFYRRQERTYYWLHKSRLLPGAWELYCLLKAAADQQGVSVLQLAGQLLSLWRLVLSLRPAAGVSAFDLATRLLEQSAGGGHAE